MAECVWILTSDDRDLAAVAGMESLQDHAELIRVGFPSTPPALRMNRLRRPPCAVVALFTRHLVTDPGFLSYVEWSVRQVERRDDFRLFVYLPPDEASDLENELRNPARRR